MTTFKPVTAIALCAVLALSTHPVPIAAQEQGSQADAAVDVSQVCMTRPFGNAAQVKREKRGQAFRILTIESAVKARESKGFKRVDCRTADFAQASRKNAWRDEICELAATGNEAVQNQLERAYGERPAVLCAGAELAVGKWDGKRKWKPKEKPKAEE